MAQEGMGGVIRWRILIVDDDDAVAYAIGKYFRRRGFEVHRCESVEAALDELERARYDLVLTDLHMPGESGLSLARTVHTRDPDLPVVLMSGSFDSKSHPREAVAHLAGVLEKPFDLSEALRMVFSLLGIGTAPAACSGTQGR